MQRCGVLFRGFLCRDLTFLRKAFITYIRPLLEFNCLIWSPREKKYIDLIEKVQRKFTKRIPCLRTLPYLERLASINLPSLELRRLHTDLLYYYKVMHHMTPFTPEQLYNYHTPPSSLRSAIPFIITPRHCTSKLLSSFIYRSVGCWNSLPTSVQTAQSLNTFKSAILLTDLSSHLYGSCFTSLNNYNIF